MKSHWWIIWKMADGSCVRDTTRGRLEPTTEEELKEYLASALRPSVLQQDLEPLVWVTDADREGRSALIFTAQVVALELEPDIRPEDQVPDAQRHLELILRAEDRGPGNYGPGQPGVPGGTVQDILRDQGFRGGHPPAGPDRHA